MSRSESEPAGGRPGVGRSRFLLLAVTASLALLVSVGAALAMGTYVWIGNEIRTIPEASGDGDSGKAPQDRDIVGHCDEQSCNYLLLGSDSRAGLTKQERIQYGTDAQIGGEQRSDTIILVHTEPDREKAVILSFPRDLWVNIPGRGFDKINAAFAAGINHGGAQLVARTVKELTGLPIHHVMYVNLAGFQDVVEAIGGVEMCFPTDLFDPLAGLDVPAGCHQLTPEQALGVVRTRNLEGDCMNPDFARIGRQQQFFRAVMSKLLSTEQILNLPSVVRTAAKAVVVDSSLSPADLAFLAGQLRGIETGAADFRAVPGHSTLLTTDPRFPSGIAIVEMDPEAEELFAALREGRALGNVGKQLEGVAISPANVPMAVFDKASGGSAQEVLGVLEAGGFDVDPLLRPATELTLDVKGSALLFEKGSEASADVVDDYVAGMKRMQVRRGSLGELDAAVVVTSGYEPTPVGEGGGSGPTVPGC